MADIFSLRESDRGRPLTDIVSLLAYDDLRRDVAKVLRDLTVLERELDLHDRGSSFIMRIRPYRSLERVIDGVVITFVDVTERRKAEQAQDVSERRFTAIVNQAPVGITETDLAGRFLLTNAAFQDMTHRSAEELQRLGRRELVNPEDVEATIARFDRAASDGEPFEAEYRLLRRDGSSVWVHDSVSVLGDADGRAVRVVSMTLEIDTRKRAEERAELLLGELDHRVRNILAIVSSIVSQTLRTNPSPEVFAATIEGRIAAIARAHSQLTEHGAVGGGSLHDLVDIELAPYRGRDLLVEGPDVVLTPKAGLSFAMAIHELASNAAKYGSLSEPKGRLVIAWTVTGGSERRLRLSWRESGGPRVAGPPAQRGFGTTLIERSMSYEWHAEVERSFAESGVVCTIDLPFTDAVGELRGPERGGGGEMTAERLAEGRRVLVVEDEMAIVLMIEETLLGIGAEVVGPAARLDAALRLAREKPIDAAVLDIAIWGGNSYAVADILAARGIPFVLCSGYSQWALEERHRHRPCLTKPYSMSALETQVLELLSAPPG